MGWLGRVACLCCLGQLAEASQQQLVQQLCPCQMLGAPDHQSQALKALRMELALQAACLAAELVYAADWLVVHAHTDHRPLEACCTAAQAGLEHH